MKRNGGKKGGRDSRESITYVLKSEQVSTGGETETSFDDAKTCTYSYYSSP